MMLGQSARATPAQTYIVTEYESGDHCIGYHFDKAPSIRKKSFITVVKTGAHGRPFELRDRVVVRSESGEDIDAMKERHKRELREQLREHKKAGTATKEFKQAQKKELSALQREQERAQGSKVPFFDEVLPPGTAIIMILEANLRTQHGVLRIADAGHSGSIVFRTITKIVPPGTRQVERMGESGR